MAAQAGSDRHRGLIPLALVVFAACSCQSKPAPARERPVVNEPSTATPAVHGCAALFVADNRLICKRGKATPLHVWWSEPFAGEAALDRVPLAVESAAFDGGSMFTLDAKLEAGAVSFEGSDWVIELSPLSRVYRDAYDELKVHARAGDDAALTRTVETAVAKLDREEAILMQCAAAKAAFSNGDFEAVVRAPAQLERQLDGDLPRPVSCLANAHIQATYVSLEHRADIEAAEAHLEAARREQEHDLPAQIDTLYHRGVLDHRFGKIHESALAFEASATLAEQVGSGRKLAAALVMQAVALARLGRFQEAQSLAEHVETRLEDLVESEALVLEVRANVAWIAVLQREERVQEGADPRALLAELQREFERLGDERSAARAALNLAVAHLQAGDTAAASDQLDVIDSAKLDPHDLVWVELTAARVGLVEGSLSVARARIDRAARLAELTGDPEHDWRLWSLRAELARAEGDNESALANYERAASLADVLALAVPGGQGRSNLATAHGRNDAAHVSALLALGRPDESLCIAAAARARHMRALWARQRPELPPADRRRYRTLLADHQTRRRAIDRELDGAWSLSDEELVELRRSLAERNEAAQTVLAEATALIEGRAPKWSCAGVRPSSDEAVLAMVDGQESATFLLGVGDEEARAVRVEHSGAGPEAVLETALDRLRPHLGEARRLEVIPSGRFMQVDVHRMVPDQVVVYSLGLGTLGERREASTQAAVIAGATDLANVRRETDSTASRLRALGWSVDDAWTPLSEAQPRLLHYSGHGRRAGVEGWASGMEIPGHGTLDARQIIAAQRSPSWVILSACSAAKADPRVVDGGMNLSVAFLLAGADLVIAPTVDVDDDAAAELSAALYGASRLDTAGFATSLAQLQRRQARDEPTVAPGRDFSSWRVWVP